MIKEIEGQGKERLENQLKELKEELRMEKGRLEDRVKAVMHEKSEVEAAH